MWPASSETTSLQKDFLSADVCVSRPVGSLESTSSSDVRCQYFLSNARSWWKVDILLNALSALNSPVTIECVTSTGSDSPVCYITDLNKIQIQASAFLTPFQYRRALARGLTYAFDNARAKIDYSNVDHLTCTSIRGANISGECDLWTKWTEYIGEDPLGMHMYSMKQRCIREKVKDNISMQSKIHTSSQIDASIDKVWDRCFRDHWPFTTEPHMDTRFRESPLVRKQ